MEADGYRKAKKEQTTIRLPAKLKEKLQQEADRLGVSFNEMLIRLIKEGLNRIIR